MPMGLNCTVGSPVAKLITHYFYIMLSQNNALVIDVSIVAELYYLRVLSSDGKDVLNKRLLKDALYLECGSK